MRTIVTKLTHRLTLQLECWVLVTALPSLLFGGWLLWLVFTELTETRSRTAHQVAEQAVDTLDRLVFERYGDALAFAGMPLVRAMDRTRLGAIADHLVTTYAPYYSMALVVDREGVIRAVNRVDGAGRPLPSAQLLGRSLAQEPWVKQALAATQPVVVEDFHQDKLVEAVYHDQRPVMSFSAPIRNEAGAVVGVWSTRLVLAPFEDVLSRPAGAPSTASPFPLTLRTAQGAILLQVGVLSQTEAPPAPLAVITATGFSRWSGLGWRLDVHRPAGALDQGRLLAWLALWVGLLVAGSAVGLGLVVYRRLIRPVLTLTLHMEGMAGKAAPLPLKHHAGEGSAGPDAEPAPPQSATLFPATALPAALITRNDELGELARTAHAMAEQLHDQLRRSRGLFEVSHAIEQAAFATPTILQLVLEHATKLTGAQYGALGVFDEAGEKLTQFITVGMDEAAKQAIEQLPTGLGLLGYLPKEQGVLRLKDLTRHPASVGFPPHHPPMRSFIGESIRAHGKLFGRLYLTEKQGAEEFTHEDEETLSSLAVLAGVVIENSLLVSQIRAAETRYRAILDSVEEGIYGVDLEGRCLFCNKAGAAALGYEPDELIGRSMHLQIHHTRADGRLYPSADCPIHVAPRTGQAVRLEPEVLWRRDGTSFPVACAVRPLYDAAGTLIGSVVSFTDLTERKHLEAQLRQTQKMEAVGHLAGGIAHDFNNLLTAILGYSAQLLARRDPDAPDYRMLEEIRKAGQRAASLTHQLLAFSRKQVLEPRVLDLNAVICEMDLMLRRLIGEDIELRTIPAPSLGRVKADPGQIEQVILNLALNARDAMPDGGRLTIETANVELDESHARTHAEVLPGAYVMLAVSDTGHGMDAATRARIFEPFFTTKPAGQGTGLGLSTVYGIIKQSGGSIWVYSEPGRGTMFKIYLPRVTGSLTPAEPSAQKAKPDRGTETILLAEDDETVRTFVGEMLAGLGYQVLVASNGEEAVQVAARHRGPIHLLVTDVVMPGMSGRALAERLARERLGLKVLYVSGYTDNAIIHHGVLDLGIAFLQKPFTQDSLAQKVREVLDAP